VKSNEVPEDVRRFLHHAVPSVPHLEALLLLRGDQERPWSVERLAAQLYLPSQRVEVIVSGLEQIGLARRVEAGVWIYAPDSEEKRKAIDRVAEYYRLNVVRVSRLLHAKPDLQALEFSDVFRWRKDR
jgi:hypothetical protein